MRHSLPPMRQTNPLSFLLLLLPQPAPHPAYHIPPTPAVLITICFYVGGYSTSWGSLAWLVAAEVVPLETRAAGFSLGSECGLY